MPTILIIGFGSNIGQATADTFARAGYSVAVASRTPWSESTFSHFAFDAAKPESVTALFRQVRESVGVPQVVVYNAYSAHITSAGKPWETTIDAFQVDVNVNITSAWVAAGEAVSGFEELGDTLGAEGGTFIYTGNCLNSIAFAGFGNFGLGKAAAANMIQHLALVEYADKPYKFYYPDQRLSDGYPMFSGLSGDAHATLYLELAQEPEQRHWNQTFVKESGYVKFPHQEVLSATQLTTKRD